MQNSNVKGHIVESGIFLVGYMVSSLVVLWGIGFGRLHQHGDTIVTYSILFGTLETLKILLTGKILRVVLFFTNVFTGYYLMAFIDIIRRRCSIHDISPLNTGTYELFFLLGIVLSGLSYILLLIKHLHTRNGDLKWRKNIRRTKKRVSEIERERGMRETLRSLNKRIPQLVSDVSQLQVGQQIENAEYVGEMSSGKVASGYGGDGERTEYAISEEGKRFLKILEGSVKNEAGLLIPYNDSNNHATKGYGILLHHGPLTEEDIRDNPPQTEASASADLAGKIAEYESILNNRTSYIYPNNVQVVDKLILTQVEVDALVCLTYNSPRIGKMIVDAIRSGCSDEEMKAIWLDDSDEQSGIGKRRLAEWQLYSRGIYNEKPYD